MHISHIAGGGVTASTSSATATVGNKQDETMGVEIVLFVSAYSSSNAQLSKTLAEANAALDEGNTGRASELYRQLREPGVAFLQSKLGNFPEVSNGNAFTPIFGLFDGFREPSIQLTLNFETEEQALRHEIDVKRALIDFGEHFQQSTVHAVDFKPRQQAGAKPGQRFGDQTTQESRFWKLTKVPPGMRNSTSLFELAKGAGIDNLTCGANFEAVLIYTMGEGGDQDRERLLGSCTNFERALKERDVLHEAVARRSISLVNYGCVSPGQDCNYGQTHSYTEARIFLNSFEEVLPELLTLIRRHPAGIPYPFLPAGVIGNPQILQSLNMRRLAIQ